MADFLPADVGRDIVANGGLGTITGYTNATTVTVEIKQAFVGVGFDSGAWVILGSPQATCTPSAKDPAGATITLTLDLGGWRPEDVGKYVRINGGLCRITSLDGTNPTTIANAVIEVGMTSVVAAPPLSWTLEGASWGDRLGWPRCGTIHEARLWLAGTTAFPIRVWASVIGDFLDHTIGSLDDDALSYDLGNGEANPITHLVNARGLVALTSAGEFSIKGGQDKPITPTNIVVKDQSNYGAAQIPPVRVGQEIYFTQRAGRKVRALSPNQYDDGQYVAPDLSTLAEHVTESGIASMAYQPEPDGTLYVVRNDGQIATLTADRDQEVFAWARQLTQGAFESVEVVPTVNGDRVFFIVARAIDGAITRYVEILDPSLYTDAAITGHSDAGASVWGGLEHLKGRTVDAKGDGVYLGEFDVSDTGQITLPRPANDVEIGLNYITSVKTLTPEFPGPTGSSQGQQLSAYEVKVRLLKTIGCHVNLQEVPFRKLGVRVLDRAPELYTGDKKAGNLGWADGVAQTLVQQRLPYPFHLLSVISRITANEG